MERATISLPLPEGPRDAHRRLAARDAGDFAPQLLDGRRRADEFMRGAGGLAGQRRACQFERGLTSVRKRCNWMGLETKSKAPRCNACTARSVLP